MADALVKIDAMAMEQQELEYHEAIIEHGLETFVEVGNALLAIRDRRLYRASGFHTFEEYCRKRWGMTKSYASRLISSVNVVDNLLPTGNKLDCILPENEWQARPLVGLGPEQQQQAWQRVIETIPDNGKITAAHVQAVIDKEFSKTEDRAIEFEAAHNKRNSHVMRVMGSSESPEWYTPQNIIDLTARLFGEIDLDPCSNSHKNPNVPAKTHYTKQDNGLSKTWHGKVYMNPPYGDEIPAWTEKLIESYECRDIEEAIALLPGRIDTQWFQPLYDYLICNIRGRLQFVGSPHSAPFPSVVVYLGENKQGFIDIFKELGPIIKRIA